MRYQVLRYSLHFEHVVIPVEWTSNQCNIVQFLSFHKKQKEILDQYLAIYL